MIVIADRGYKWVADKEEYAEMTFLIGFRLNGGSAKHAVVGSVFGSPLNPYTLDMVEESDMVYIRIATTITFWSGFEFANQGGGEMIDSWVDNDIADPYSETFNTWNKIVVLGVNSVTATIATS